MIALEDGPCWRRQVLVVFYRGFLSLSKSFLDPFGNGDSLAENFSISCLLCESNGGSVRWLDAIQELPFDTTPTPAVAAASPRGRGSAETAPRRS